MSYFGTMMVHVGEADGMVSGAAHTTADHPGVRDHPDALAPRSSSSVFFMCLEDRVLVYGDCAIVGPPLSGW